MSASEGLYPPLVIKHSKDPRHFYEMSDATHKMLAYNPLCGDRYNVFMRIEDGRILRTSFHGYGCALSKAASSLMIERLQQISIDESAQILQHFFAILAGAQKEQYQVFQIFDGVRRFPERRDCVVLTADALQDFLNNEKNKS